MNSESDTCPTCGRPLPGLNPAALLPPESLSSDPDFPRRPSIDGVGVDPNLDRGRLSGSSAGAGTADALAGLDLGPTPHARDSSEMVTVVNDFDPDPPPGSRWPRLLLISYASAVTLGLIWTLAGGRRAALRPEAPAAEPAGDRGGRARLSGRSVPEPLLAADRLVDFGGSIRVGDLEIIPTDIERGPVVLHRVAGTNKQRDGGPDALRLRLRLKNRSTDAMFAPLDESFVRETATGPPGSSIESGNGDRIYAYPLAEASEWAIEGQTFPTLRPGESAAIWIVTAANAPPLADGPVIWRLKLRTGIGRVDVVGVRFRATDVARVLVEKRLGSPPEPGRDRAKP